MNLTSNDINDLIEMGRIENLDPHLLQTFSKRDYINRQDGNTWRELVAPLSDIELISVFKALVRIEKELNWIGGSVAGAIWVYKIIENRFLDEDYKIADYGFRNCENPWVPFGSSYYGKRTIEDYLKFKREKAIENRLRTNRNEKILIRVKGRNERRALAIAELRKLSKEERGKIRNELLKTYANATINEKLTLIAENKKYPPEYYPLEWIYIPIEEIEKLPIELIRQLYDKLSTKTKGEWRRFGQKLEKLDNNQ